MSELLLLHRIGLLLGFGGATISAILMLFVAIDESKRYRFGRIARRISIVTWIGLALLFISGISMAIQYYSELSKLILGVKCFTCAIILVDALIIHLRLFPRYFQQIDREGFDSTFRHMVMIGTLSITCWIVTIILGFLLRV